MTFLAPKHSRDAYNDNALVISSCRVRWSKMSTTRLFRSAFRARYPLLGAQNQVTCTGRWRQQSFQPVKVFTRGANGTQSPQPDPDPSPTPDYASAGDEKSDSWKHTAWKMFESAATTGASILVLGLVGYSYTLYYKRHVLNKMERAFDPGGPYYGQ